MIFLLLGRLAATALAAPAPAKHVSFKTSDGWTIAALYHAPQKDRPVAVLVHGVAAGKGEWSKLCEALWDLGYGTLAIDLRGHGESIHGPKGKQGYPSFDELGEWPRAEEDVHAALRFLKSKGIPASRVGLIGGSTGANIVSQAAAHAPVRWEVLLSPGQEYRGLGLADLEGRKALVAASPGDAYAHQTAVSLAMHAYGPVYIEAPKGHGAQLIDDPEFVAKLLDWIKKN